MWHYAVCRLVVAARARGWRPSDGPFHDPEDPEGFAAAARRAAVLGCEGKWGNDNEAMKLANQAFTPPRGKVERARRVLQAAEGRKAGGVFVVAGKPLFMPAIRQAEILVRKAEMLGM
jgi:malyl-CoA/(S)-citramalyl-CoA lyase